MEKSARKKINRIVYHLCRISSEKIAEHKSKNNHCKKRLQKCPQNTKHGVAVLQLYIFRNKLTEKITVFANREDQAQDEEEITNEVREVATIVIMPTLPKGNLWRMTEGIETFRKEAKQKRFAPQKEEIKSNSFTNAEMIYILEKQLEYKVFDDKEEEKIKAEIAQLKQTA